MKVVNGITKNISSPIIGRIKKGSYSLGFGADVVLAAEENPILAMGCAAVLTKSNAERRGPTISVEKEEFDSLNDGDIIRITPDGAIHVLWEASSHQNCVLVTDYCNSACIMCPQKPDDPSSYHDLNKRILSLVQDGEKVEHVGISGGEPTLYTEQLTEILRTCYKKFPNASISLLTNGKLLSDFDVAKKLVCSNPNVVYCIPLYAPTDTEHDYIVGAPGSFQQTLLGIYNLARFHRPVEIRIVILKQNYKRIQELAEFIYRNIPFVVHIAIMGMETTGAAKENLADVWIDPNEYQKELRQAVLEFNRRAMNVSIYNLPLCLLPRELWKFARDSISGWKRAFLPQCESCCEKESCAGIFATSVKQSQFIIPINKEEC